MRDPEEFGGEGVTNRSVTTSSFEFESWGYAVFFILDLIALFFILDLIALFVVVGVFGMTVFLRAESGVCRWAS